MKVTKGMLGDALDAMKSDNYDSVSQHWLDEYGFQPHHVAQECMRRLYEGWDELENVVEVVRKSEIPAIVKAAQTRLAIKRLIGGDDESN